jgi:hypothetical protein
MFKEPLAAVADLVTDASVPETVTVPMLSDPVIDVLPGV